MKKIILCIFILVVVSGCSKYDSRGSTKSGDMHFDKRCIDGVEYLMRHVGVGYMSPHISEETLLPIRCK